MRIKNSDDRDIALRKYAIEIGISTHHLVDPNTGKTYEPALIGRIGDVERHNTNVRLTKISIFVIAIGILWGIVYSVFIYPPKYVLDESSLHFGRWFKGWVKQEKQRDNEVNIYKAGAEFELHFVLRNLHRGEGDVSKPRLVITAENSDKKYEVRPTTSYVSSKKEGENVMSYTEVDLGRTIHVGPYGIVDVFLEYSIRPRENDGEIIEFLNANQDKLCFKIKGYPYKDTEVTLLEDD